MPKTWDSESYYDVLRHIHVSAAVFEELNVLLGSTFFELSMCIQNTALLTIDLFSRWNSNQVLLQNDLEISRCISLLSPATDL